MLAILFRFFDFLVLKIMWLSHLSVLSVPGEGYSRIAHGMCEATVLFLIQVI